MAGAFLHANDTTHIPLRTEPTAPGDPFPPSAAPRSILLVDDNPAKSLALQGVAEELGYRVVVATSGEAALRELLKEAFSAALIDVQMPVMDGFELGALIRSRPAHRDLALVFMSAIDQSDERLENAYRLGAIDFIPLPARRSVIKAKLTSLLALQEKAHRLECINREQEAALAQLQEVVAELEAFSYSVSHDLKAPLRSVHCFADVVIHDYGDVLKGDGLQHMQRIRRATEQLQGMVEDVLKLSRLPRTALPLAPVDLNQLLSALKEESIQFRQAAAQIDIERSLPLVWGHESSLRQVFSNLLENALKFMPDDRAPLVTIRAEVVAGEATIWIEDNGVGVRPEDRERIFQAFERGSTPRPFPGSGVGLAIVQRTVERLNGTVGVLAGAFAGSRFWVKLRVAPPRPS